MTYFQKLFGLIALCTLAVVLAACVDQPDDEAADEVTDEVAREIATDDVDDLEIGMSEVQQASAVSLLCSGCIRNTCLFYCSPEMRYRVAEGCYQRGRCTYDEFQRFRPRYQEP